MPVEQKDASLHPDGRYILIRRRLWRKSNPNLQEERQTQIAKELMSARTAVKEAGGDGGASPLCAESHSCRKGGARRA